MRIRGNDKITTYLEKSETLLDLNPQKADLIDAKRYDDLRLEIGCGRGAFLSQMAAMNPTVYFFGVEKFIPIIARAAALAASNELSNVHFYKMDIANALTIFQRRAFSIIYLNFSDPWPKRRHDKHRLTHSRFLAIYEALLRQEGWVELKTDNEDFFEWSIESFRHAGWEFITVDRDLSSAPPLGNEHEGRFAKTEYETRFRRLGQPIYYLQAKPPVK